MGVDAAPAVLQLVGHLLSKFPESRSASLH
jgi:hypothetical protein